MLTGGTTKLGVLLAIVGILSAGAVGALLHWLPAIPMAALAAAAWVSERGLANSQRSINDESYDHVVWGYLAKIARTGIMGFAAIAAILVINWALGQPI